MQNDEAVFGFPDYGYSRDLASRSDFDPDRLQPIPRRMVIGLFEPDGEGDTLMDDRFSLLKQFPCACLRGGHKWIFLLIDHKYFHELLSGGLRHQPPR